MVAALAGTGIDVDDLSLDHIQVVRLFKKHFKSDSSKLRKQNGQPIQDRAEEEQTARYRRHQARRQPGLLNQPQHGFCPTIQALDLQRQSFPLSVSRYQQEAKKG